MEDLARQIEAGLAHVNGDRNCYLALRMVTCGSSLPESCIMGVSKRQTARNRQAILDAASRLFRERGVDGVGLNELMREAGFTQVEVHFKWAEAAIYGGVRPHIKREPGRLANQPRRKPWNR